MSAASHSPHEGKQTDKSQQFQKLRITCNICFFPNNLTEKKIQILEQMRLDWEKSMIYIWLHPATEQQVRPERGKKELGPRSIQCWQKLKNPALGCRWQTVQGWSGEGQHPPLAGTLQADSSRVRTEDGSLRVCLLSSPWRPREEQQPWHSQHRGCDWASCCGIRGSGIWTLDWKTANHKSAPSAAAYTEGRRQRGWVTCSWHFHTQH